MYTDKRKLGITFNEVLAKLPSEIASHLEQMENNASHWIDIQPVKFTDTVLRIRIDDGHFGRIYYSLPLPTGDHLVSSWEEVTVITLLPLASVQPPLTPANSKMVELVKAQEYGTSWCKVLQKLVSEGWQVAYETARLMERNKEHKPNCNTNKPIAHISYHAILKKDDLAIRLFDRNSYYPFCGC